MRMRSTINKDKILNGHENTQHAAAMMLLQAGIRPRSGHRPRLDQG